MRPNKPLRQAKIQAVKKTSFSYAHLFGACLLTSVLALNGCATNSAAKTTSKQSSTVSTIENQLTAEFVYRYLVAEVAGQRGDLATSSAIFYDLAKTTRDPSLAERAAKIAAYGTCLT